MTCIKQGSKASGFHQQGHHWFCLKGLPSDVTVEVGEISFHLDKFPLLSKSGCLEKLIREKSNEGEEEECIVQLSEVPGGAEAFEIIAKFCYGVKLELTASNVAYVRSAAEHLEMTEEIAEGNLITRAEIFLDQVVLQRWKDSLKALQSCDRILPQAGDLQIVRRCMDSLALKACKWPSGSVLRNGISTGARPRINGSHGWWYEDVSSLSLPLYKNLISLMEAQGMRQEIISGSVAFYSKRHLPGLYRQQRAMTLTSEEQQQLLEEIDRLLPLKKGVVSTEDLFGFLRSAMILQAGPSCVSNLERRIGMQLDQASLKDLLIPNLSDSKETLYDVDCIQRIVVHFLDRNQMTHEQDHSPLTVAARLIDGYLAEIASDANLEKSMFRSLAAAIPEEARELNDGLYHAIDIYLKAHPWLTESEREEMCMAMDCQKLSLEACIHAAKNKSLPLRVVIQVLFIEQLRLRSVMAERFNVSDNLEESRWGRSEGGGWSSAVLREIDILKVRMGSIRVKMTDLEEEFLSIREAMQKIIAGRSSEWIATPWANLWSNIKSLMCSTQDDVISNERNKG